MVEDLGDVGGGTAERPVTPAPTIATSTSRSPGSGGRRGTSNGFHQSES